MLDRVFNFDHDFGDAWEQYPAYDQGLIQDSHWGTSKRRLLVIMQNVDGRDLKAGSMLGDKNVRKAFTKAYNYARKTATPYTKSGAVPEFALTVINFNGFRHLHIKNPTKRKEAEAAFAERVKKLIRKLEPTHMLVSGDEAMASLFPKVEHPQYKRGWVHQIKVNGNPCSVVSTVDFARLLEKDGQYANLLGYWTRHLAWLLLNRNPHSLAGYEIKPNYIKTMAEFEALMEKWDTCKQVAVDTEAKNLSSLHNRLYTIQFAFDTDPHTGHILSIDHPMVHWTTEEKKIIKKALRKRFGALEGPMMLMFNGHGFDLRLIRRTLKIPIIWLKVWEISFAEHELDENRSLLNDTVSMADASKKGKKSTYGGLSPLCCEYGNDHYLTAAFSKEERTTIGGVDVGSNTDAQVYMAADVVLLLAIKQQQIARARHMFVRGRDFQPMFVRHMLCQMSDTAHTISHMRDDGSIISKSGLEELMESDSSMRKEARQIEQQLRMYPEVKSANKAILNSTGFKAGGLFSSKEPWTLKLSKPDHKEKLFFEVLGLEPISTTATGKGAIDKAFVDFYRDKNKIVGLYGDHQAVGKLMSTYVKGWYKRLMTNVDEATDNALRADYFLVDTGRLGSSKPKLGF